MQPSDYRRVRTIPGVSQETEMTCLCEQHFYMVPWSWVRDGQGVTCGPSCRPNKEHS